MTNPTEKVGIKYTADNSEFKKAAKENEAALGAQEKAAESTTQALEKEAKQLDKTSDSVSKNTKATKDNELNLRRKKREIENTILVLQKEGRQLDLNSDKGRKRAIEIQANVRAHAAERRELTGKLTVLREDARITALAGTQTKSLTTNLLGAVGPIAAVTAGLTALGTAIQSVKTFGDFERTLNTISAVSGNTAAQMDVLKKSTQDLGATTIFSTQQVAEGYLNLARSGFNAEQSLAAMPGILDAAAAAGSDLATSTSIVAGTLRSFGLEAEKSTLVADTLAKASNIADGEIADFGDAFKQLGPVARAANQSLGDNAAILSILANQMIKGSDAGTDLKGILARMVNPEQAKLINELGINVADTSGKIRPLIDIIIDFKKKFGDLRQDAQLGLAVKIAGQENMKSMIALINTSEEDLKAMRKEFENVDGSAKKAADTINQGINTTLEQAGGAAEKFGIALGELLAPAVNAVLIPLTDLLSNSADLISEFSQGVRGVTDYGSTMQVLGDIARQVAEYIGEVFGATADLISILLQAVTSCLGFENALDETSEAGSRLRSIVLRVANAIDMLTTGARKSTIELRALIETARRAAKLDFKGAGDAFNKGVEASNNVIKERDERIKERDRQIEFAARGQTPIPKLPPKDPPKAPPKPPPVGGTETFDVGSGSGKGKKGPTLVSQAEVLRAAKELGIGNIRFTTKDSLTQEDAEILLRSALRLKQSGNKSSIQVSAAFTNKGHSDGKGGEHKRGALDVGFAGLSKADILAQIKAFDLDEETESIGVTGFQGAGQKLRQLKGHSDHLHVRGLKAAGQKGLGGLVSKIENERERLERQALEFAGKSTGNDLRRVELDERKGLLGLGAFPTELGRLNVQVDAVNQKIEVLTRGLQQVEKTSASSAEQVERKKQATEQLNTAIEDEKIKLEELAAQQIVQKNQLENEIELLKKEASNITADAQAERSSQLLQSQQEEIARLFEQGRISAVEYYNALNAAAQQQHDQEVAAIQREIELLQTKLDQMEKINASEADKLEIQNRILAFTEKITTLGVVLDQNKKGNQITAFANNIPNYGQQLKQGFQSSLSQGIGDALKSGDVKTALKNFGGAIKNMLIDAFADAISRRISALFDELINYLGGKLSGLAGEVKQPFVNGNGPLAPPSAGGLKSLFSPKALGAMGIAIGASLISGASKKAAQGKSSIGQGALGGALSGGSAGFMLGNMLFPGIGGLIGAGAGALGGGLFGAAAGSTKPSFLSKALGAGAGFAISPVAGVLGLLFGRSKKKQAEQAKKQKQLEKAQAFFNGQLGSADPNNVQDLTNRLLAVQNYRSGGGAAFRAKQDAYNQLYALIQQRYKAIQEFVSDIKNTNRILDLEIQAVGKTGADLIEIERQKKLIELEAERDKLLEQFKDSEQAKTLILEQFAKKRELIQKQEQEAAKADLEELKDLLEERNNIANENVFTRRKSRETVKEEQLKEIDAEIAEKLKETQKLLDLGIQPLPFKGLDQILSSVNASRTVNAKLDIIIQEANNPAYISKEIEKAFDEFSKSIAGAIAA